ncbi:MULTISPECIES: helix-turn-helix domain-containing protein [Ectopseudomonas]|uniref:helix-turn-helix domain-containing protein n=1 Tax=Ectopseudomonas TaxID=3236654 RepID=UPI0009A20D77|nr:MULTISPECIES: helix-turn-helix transcriptional regulator [Pseudomonas]MBP3062134.1 helix-turn-helix domain-containing protein [Pseudomonas chengduensis]NNB75426.1 helix-turn-helix transcriptional regulator [Pseudomonas chengduensis]
MEDSGRGYRDDFCFCTQGSNRIRNHNVAFGIALRKLRKSRKFSQEALAFESGIARNHVSLLELGQRSPTLDTITALADALGVSLVEIITLTQSIRCEPSRKEPHDPGRSS